MRGIVRSYVDFMGTEGRVDTISCGTTDIGSTESMKECLSWERWIYSPRLYEIFPYYEGKTTVFHGDIIEE